MSNKELKNTIIDWSNCLATVKIWGNDLLNKVRDAAGTDESLYRSLSKYMEMTQDSYVAIISMLETLYDVQEIYEEGSS